MTTYAGCCQSYSPVFPDSAEKPLANCETPVEFSSIRSLIPNLESCFHYQRKVIPEQPLTIYPFPREFFMELFL